MKVILIDDSMRTDDNNGIGTKLCRRTHDLTIGGDGVRNLLLAARPDGWNDERRMRNGIGGKDGHNAHSLIEKKPTAKQSDL